jgi:acyl-coenzyme A synthetase/AMP-(fatty) acid ligase
MSNLVDPIHAHARTMPDKAALLLPGNRVSWQQLDQAIWRCVLALGERGFKQGELVGVTFANPLLHLVITLALARIGARQVILTPGDPVQDCIEAVKFLGVESIITDTAWSGPDLPRQVQLEKIPTPESKVVNFSDYVGIGGDSTWLLVRSSGTTGNPKYAEVTHRVSMERFERWSDAYDYMEGDIFWIGIDMNTVTGKQQNVSALQAGITVCLPTGMPQYADRARFARESGITLAYDIPSHLRRLVALADQQPYFQQVRRFYTGTTEASNELRREFCSRVTPHLCINYGTNEVPCAVTAMPELYNRIKDTVGHPHRRLELQVVNDAGATLQPGVTGEIRIRGAGMVSGYYRDPSMTARSFRDGWFYPGDLGYLTPEGALILQGRTDDMMIYDGVNIYPAEIERVLSAHPAVLEVAAFSSKHEEFQEVPVAAVVPREAVQERDLRQWGAERLGMRCPVRIILVDQLPRNAAGKVMRRELNNRLREQLSGGA